MDLIRSWAVAVVVWFVAAVGSAAVAATVDAEWLRSTAGTLMWNGSVAFVTYALMAASAAAVHPGPGRGGPLPGGPQRGGPRRHALAVVAVPALALVASLLNGVFGGGPPAGLAAEVLLGCAGVAAGWFPVNTLRRTRQRDDNLQAENAALRY